MRHYGDPSWLEWVVGALVVAFLIVVAAALTVFLIYMVIYGGYLNGWWPAPVLKGTK